MEADAKERGAAELRLCQFGRALVAAAAGPRILRWLMGGLALSTLLQALVVYAPRMNTLFHTVPLPLDSWLSLLLLASAVNWVKGARKLRVRAGSRARPRHDAGAQA